MNRRQDFRKVNKKMGIIQSVARFLTDRDFLSASGPAQLDEIVLWREASAYD
ncbi:MAG: hypothetical protein ACKOBC_07390 [Hyphomicrobiales bacterium]